MPSSVSVFHGSSRIDAPDRFAMDVAERASVVGRPLFNPIGAVDPRAMRGAKCSGCRSRAITVVPGFVDGLVEPVWSA